MSERERNRARNRTLLGLVLLAAAVIVVVLAAAGGDPGSNPTTAASEGTVSNNGDTTEIVTASYPTGRDTDEVSASGADPIAPCTLVPKKKAESILGAGVKVSERPQGPTCVYSGSGREVDLVVEKRSVKSLKDGAKSAKPVTIRGKQGWCLQYENTSVVIAVGSGRTLQVTGPCQAGVRFAAVALPRI
jgi:hypothetical protein